MILGHFETREGLGGGLRTYTTQYLLGGRHNRHSENRDLHLKLSLLLLTRPRSLSFEDLFYIGVQFFVTKVNRSR